MLGNFSVILPIHAGTNSKELGDAILSVISSTLPPAELVISQDGPINFDISRILDSFACATRFNLVISTQNQGPGMARNKAIEAASTPVIALMDSDDICKKNRFELQYKLIMEDEIDVVGGLIKEFGPDASSISYIRYVPENNSEIYRKAKFYQTVNNVTLMFQRDIFLNIGGYKISRYLEDYDLLYRFILNGYTFKNIQSILVDVRAGDAVAKRRMGVRYFVEEQKLLYRMYRDGFLNLFQYTRNVILRSIYRIFYNKVFGYVHKKMMRKVE
jgi:glycosyltransferase involved in cell wall biosynthesis